MGGFEHWTELQESPESVTVCEAVDRTLIYRHLLRAVLRAPGGEIPPGGLVILLRSERAARRVMESRTDLLEETLVLPESGQEPCGSGQGEEFTASRFCEGTYGSAPRHGDASRIGARLDATKQRPVDDTGHPGPVGIPARMGELFRIREFRKVFKDLDGFIRRRSLHAVEEMDRAGFSG